MGQLDGRAFAASESVLLFDLGVNGYLAMVFFGAASLHALITAPQGLAGQLHGAWTSWQSNRRARQGRR